MGKPRVEFKHPELRRQHQERTVGQIAADALAHIVGSWRFVIIQSILIFGFWIPLNAGLVIYQFIHLRHWDPYPFILLNLMLSLQAAYTGPVLQLSSNRQSLKDRALWEHTALEADKNDKRMLIVLESLRILLQEVRNETHSIEAEIEALRR